MRWVLVFLVYVLLIPAVLLKIGALTLEMAAICFAHPAERLLKMAEKA